MGMLKKKIINEIEDVCGFLCSRCGGIFLAGGTDFDYENYLHIEFLAGYGSTWGDGNIVDIVLCDGCSKIILRPFATVTDSLVEGVNNA